MHGGTQLPECILGRPIIDLGLRHAPDSEYWGLADRGKKRRQRGHLKRSMILASRFDIEYRSTQYLRPRELHPGLGASTTQLNPSYHVAGKSRCHQLVVGVSQETPKGTAPKRER